MTPTDRAAAAAALVAARHEGAKLDRLPEEARPDTDDDALAIQREVVRLLGEEIGGWKTALPRGHDLIVAPLMRSTIHASATCPAPSYGGMGRIEPEVAFVLGRDLPSRDPEYTEDEVRRAIGDTRLVLEIMGGRYNDPQAIPFHEFLADSINNEGLLLGPSVSNPFSRNLSAFWITLDGPGGRLLETEGHHPNGHPLRGLVWLANFLRERGDGLREGEVVTTGTYAGVLEAPLSAELTITFGDLGRWSFTLLPSR